MSPSRHDHGFHLEETRRTGISLYQSGDVQVECRTDDRPRVLAFVTVHTHIEVGLHAHGKGRHHLLANLNDAHPSTAVGNIFHWEKHGMIASHRQADAPIVSKACPLQWLVPGICHYGRDEEQNGCQKSFHKFIGSPL